jgi:hypothetical protein
MHETKPRSGLMIAGVLALILWALIVVIILRFA